MKPLPARRVVAACMLAVAVLAFHASPAGAVSVDVDIVESQLRPAFVRIEVGDLVRWTNGDQREHRIRSDADSQEHFDSGSLAAGESYTHVFETAGTFWYTCRCKDEAPGVIDVVLPATTTTTTEPPAEPAPDEPPTTEPPPVEPDPDGSTTTTGPPPAENDPEGPTTTTAPPAGEPPPTEPAPPGPAPEPGGGRPTSTTQYRPSPDPSDRTNSAYPGPDRAVSMSVGDPGTSSPPPSATTVPTRSTATTGPGAPLPVASSPADAAGIEEEAAVTHGAGGAPDSAAGPIGSAWPEAGWLALACASAFAAWRVRKISRPTASE